MNSNQELIKKIIIDCSKLGSALKKIACMNQRMLFDEQGINAYGEISLKIDIMLEKLCLEFFKENEYIRAIISEESGYINTGKGRFTVVIDPLDGTKNFTMGLSYYACAIAILDEYNQVIGAYVINLSNGHEYRAVKGLNAYRNGVQICTATQINLTECDGIFVGLSKTEDELEIIKHTLSHLKSYRAMGCAALDICSLSMGAVSAFFDISNTAKLVDVLASSLILEESGGIITDSYGVPITKLLLQNKVEDVVLHQKFLMVAAANKNLHKKLINILALDERNKAIYKEDYNVSTT